LTTYAARDLQASLCRLHGPTRGARANRAQIVERIDPRSMPVAPIYADGVTAHRFDVQHLKRGCKHLERVGRLGRSVVGLLRRSAVRAGTGGAGTLVAQVAQFVIAMMAIFPIDLDALRFGNGDVLGFRCVHSLVQCRGRRRCGGWRRLPAPAAACP